MVSLPVFNRTGQEVGTYEIDPAELAPRISKQLLHDAVVMYQSNLRLGTAKTKSRSEVAATTKKMYRQKGTGNARAGSRATNIRRGGGHAFAKRPRDWSYRLPKKAVRLATRMAVASRIADDEITLIDDLSFYRVGFAGGPPGGVFLAQRQKPQRARAQQRQPVLADAEQIGRKKRRIGDREHVVLRALGGVEIARIVQAGGRPRRARRPRPRGGPRRSARTGCIRLRSDRRSSETARARPGCRPASRLKPPAPATIRPRPDGGSPTTLPR